MRFVYMILWLFVACVSAFDTYANIRYPVTHLVELNPIAKFILFQSNNDVALLIAIKFLGTSVVLGLLLVLYRNKFAWMVMSAVALFQLWLLGFLIYA